MPLSNKRAHPRAPIRQRCWCESGSITIYAQLGNLSEGGLFVKTFAPLNQGSRATVRWNLGEDEPDEILAEAVVVWRRDGAEYREEPPGMGLRFEHLSAADRDRIREYVDRTTAANSG